MRWGLWLKSRVTGDPIDTCEAATHAEALATLRLHPSVGDNELIVEPVTEDGHCHDTRHYSQSGPVLTQDEL